MKCVLFYFKKLSQCRTITEVMSEKVGNSDSLVDS